MGNVLGNLLPIILVSAVYPIGLIINTLLLIGENGVAKSAAFIGGATLTRLVQGLLFGFVFASVYGTDGGDDSSPIISILFLIIGLVFAIGGIKAYRNEPDPDEPPSSNSKIDSLTPAKTLLLGAAWVLLSVKLWLFTLEALNIISEAGLNPTESIITYLIYAIGCVGLLLILLIMCIVAPEPSKAVLGKLRVWLDRNNRAIKIAVSGVFGVFFLYQGITGLLG